MIEKMHLKQLLGPWFEKYGQYKRFVSREVQVEYPIPFQTTFLI